MTSRLPLFTFFHSPLPLYLREPPTPSSHSLPPFLHFLFPLLPFPSSSFFSCSDRGNGAGNSRFTIRNELSCCPSVHLSISVYPFILSPPVHPSKSFCLFFCWRNPVLVIYLYLEACPLKQIVLPPVYLALFVQFFSLVFTTGKTYIHSQRAHFVPWTLTCLKGFIFSVEQCARVKPCRE